MTDLDATLAAAVGAQPAWAADAGARARALDALADGVADAAGELAATMVDEVGKPVVEARAEVVRAEAILRFYAQVALDPAGELLPTPPGALELRAERVPRGVVAAICPWNFPLAIPLWKMKPTASWRRSESWLSVSPVSD